jgi:hypothetical protein
LYIGNKFGNRGGVGQSGITGHKSFKGFVDFASLDSKKEGLELFLNSCGGWFGIGISGKELRDESGDLG